MPAYLLWPISIVLALVLFSLAVFIHELGHFVVARLLGLRADVFSIGFGPALWKRQLGNTEVRLSAIPFGGYVSLPQLDPEGMEKLQGGGEHLPPAAPWKRILVAVAGPMGNVVLALICACAIAWFAPPEATGASTEIGYVEPQSNAWAAGLRVKDRIVTVEGHAVQSWSDVLTECMLAGGSNETVRLTIERAGERREIATVLDTPLGDAESGMWTIGGVMRGPLELGISEVSPDTPAAQAGLQAGEVILTVNGEPFTHFAQIQERADPLAPVVLQVRPFIQPEAPSRTVTVQPAVLEAIAGEATDAKPRLGVVLGFFTQRHFQWMTERSVGAQIRSDAAGVWRVLSALTAPKHAGERGRVAKSLGGPLAIFTILVQVIQVGLWVSLGFLRLICINLAILNLLPLPVLDGGHILFALFATVARREVPAKVVGYLTNAFAVLLIGVMLWFLYSDAMRLF